MRGEDGDFDSARERAAAVARRDGIRLVEDSLDIETCEGAATIGLELTDTAAPFDAVLIALGGGALATGVGHVVKARAPGVDVICGAYHRWTGVAAGGAGRGASG